MNEVKKVLQEQIEKLKAEGYTQLEIEIELLHYLKKVVYPERYQ